MFVWLIEWIPIITLIGGGGFAFWKFWDQRRRELQEQRFEQYWKLIDVSQESAFLAKQKVALLLLRRYPEYRSETNEFLKEASTPDSVWAQNNKRQIEAVLKHFQS